jgi:hypothetical protein
MALLEWQAKKGHPDLRARLDHLEPPDRLDRWAHQANPASNKTMLQTSFEVAPVGGLFYCFEVRSLNSREPLVMPALSHPQKITFGEMRSTGVRGVLVYCSDYKCSHSIAISADPMA